MLGVRSGVGSVTRPTCSLSAAAGIGTGERSENREDVVEIDAIVSDTCRCDVGVGASDKVAETTQCAEDVVQIDCRRNLATFRVAVPCEEVVTLAAEAPIAAAHIVVVAHRCCA